MMVYVWIGVGGGKGRIELRSDGWTQRERKLEKFELLRDELDSEELNLVRKSPGRHVDEHNIVESLNDLLRTIDSDSKRGS